MFSIIHVRRFLFVVILLFSKASLGQSISSDSSATIISKRVRGRMTVDGNLNEPEWSQVSAIRYFKQVEPYQGDSAKFDTEVRILYNEKNLYIGVFARDAAGRKGIRVPDLGRDFSFGDNDLFGIALDPLGTKRNAVAFQVTPFGTQRDLPSFDDAVFDVDWDALWYAKTKITDSGWYAELAIPFQSIRYEQDNPSWGINFIRIRRATNEISAWPGFPRSFDTYRMTYAAKLEGLELPKQGVNIRLNPYLLEQVNSDRKNGKQNNQFSTKVGGDIKWAVSQHGVLDATFNTDFAQADVDRQVINLTRFSVYFPERRQFFLENSGLFLTGDGENIEPFFSRRIGLDEQGNAIPLLAGAKYTDRTSKRSIGAIYALQDGYDSIGKTNFSAFRYIHNYGNANNTGIMLTNKFISATHHNTVASVSGVHRIGENWRFKYLWSHSFDKLNNETKNGFGGNINIDYSSNKWFFLSNHSLISESYLPGVGFVSRPNLFTHSTGIIPVIRPSWKPRFVRSFQPGVFINASQKASNLQMQEGSLSVFPVYLLLNDGGLVSFRYQYNWQLLTEDFNVVDQVIPKGNYYYHRYRLKYNTDLSKKFSISGSVETGGYFDGNLRSFNTELKIAPIPYLSFLGGYELNLIENLGITKASFNTHLFTSTLRLALNPNIQLVSFYQYNSTGKNSRVNLRFSWQYRPLSFIYLVFNTGNNRITKESEQQAVFKINFLKQLG